ncbi:hypothetical protein Fot_14298 [Forsythia ovata]|uniref:Uncharacterized protein n=1 Tax=Forsythia ovata TaxID=205694 RepID=A0ABD1W6F2_9LAMI
MEWVAAANAVLQKVEVKTLVPVVVWLLEKQLRLRWKDFHWRRLLIKEPKKMEWVAAANAVLQKVEVKTLVPVVVWLLEKQLRLLLWWHCDGYGEFSSSEWWSLSLPLIVS